MRLLRDTYRPGKDRLAYVAVDVNAAAVVTRVYGPAYRPKSNNSEKLNLYKLDFEFKELGNYIFRG